MHSKQAPRSHGVSDRETAPLTVRSMVGAVVLLTLVTLVLLYPPTAVAVAVLSAAGVLL